MANTINRHLKIPCLDAAVHLLSQREHAQSELRKKLNARGYTNNDINHTLARLTASNLQSDERFTQAYVRQKYPKIGDWRLHVELSQYGIDEDIIVNAIKTECKQPEAQRITAILAQKYPNGIPTDQQQRARRFLGQRGFNNDTCRRILEKHQHSCD